MSKSEVRFFGIPKSDWLPVSIHIILSAFILWLLAKTLPLALCVAVYAWVVVGRALLVKHGAISRPYPNTIGGGILSYLMAVAWPYFCHIKKRDV